MEVTFMSFKDFYTAIFDEILAPATAKARKQAWIQLMDKLKYKERLPLVLVRKRAMWEGAEGWSNTMMYEIAGTTGDQDRYFYKDGDFYYDQNVENGIVRPVELNAEINERVLLGRMDEIFRLGYTLNKKALGIHLPPGFYYFTWDVSHVAGGANTAANTPIEARDVESAIKKWRGLSFPNGGSHVENPKVFYDSKWHEIKMIDEAGGEMKSWRQREERVWFVLRD